MGRDEDNYNPLDRMLDAAREMVAELVGADGGESGEKSEPKTDRVKRERSLEVISLDRIDPRPNNREVYQERIDRLVKSIPRDGLIYPITVWQHGDDAKGPRYEVIDGMHRYNAHVLLKCTTILCIVEHDTDPEKANRLGSTANRLRWAPSVWDDFTEILRYRSANEHATIDEVAEETSIPRAHVEKMFAIQDHVCQDLWTKLRDYPDWDTIVRLRTAARIGPELSRAARREKQLAWWKAESWVKQKVLKIRQGRPRKTAVRARAERYAKKKSVPGWEVQRAMLWVIGEAKLRID